MPTQRKTYSAELQASIALEAITGQRTVNGIASHDGVHPKQVMHWKTQALAELPHGFSERRTRSSQDEDTLTAQLYQQIGQVKVELDWLKKKLDDSVDVTRELIEPWPPRISVRPQCELLGLSRRGLSDEPGQESADTLWLMHLLDEPYTRTPSDGMRRKTAWLRMQGDQVNHKRVQRLLWLMGLEAIYPKPRPNQLAGRPQVSPYLRREVHVARVQQVWSTDITDIRLLHGFVSWVIILDGLSRDVLAWEVSATLDSDFCSSTLERALVHAQSDMFNSDQGAQFTSTAFTERLRARSYSSGRRNP